MTALSLEHASDNAIDGDGITNHLDCLEPETSLPVRREFAAQVHLRLIRILVLIKTDRGCVPDVDFGTRYRIAFAIDDTSMDEKRRTGRVGPDDRAAVFNSWRIQAPKWSKKRL
ncbi:hypothetical protein D3C87_1385430 [compost metagenome]